jgi:hypothetical protein
MRWAGWWVAVACAVACGGSQPGGGSGGGGGTDAGPTDGGPDGGVSSDCDNVQLPQPGTAVTFDVASSGAPCGTTMIDGSGITVCRVQSAWLEYLPNGTRSGTFGAPPDLFAQRSGFIGVFGDAAPFTVALWSQGGREQLSDVTGDALALGPASGAGVIAVTANSGTLSVQKLDATGNQITSTEVTSPATPVGAAEDATGAVLALTSSGNSVSGFWVDLTQKAAGQPFALGTASSVAARPLLGSGIVLRFDGRWVGVLHPGETTLQPPPSWIGTAADVVQVRGGTALALVPPTGNRVEIISPKGNSCGFVTFPGVTAVSLGVDGSAVGSTGNGSCTKLVWRNMLQ